jgi:hypothetical protein
VSLRGTGHEHGSYRMVNYDFINLSLCKEVDGVPKPDVYISFESSLSAFCFSKILSESEEIENLLSESEAKRHGNFPSESEANLPFEIFAFSLLSQESNYYAKHCKDPKTRGLSDIDTNMLIPNEYSIFRREDCNVHNK